MIFEIKLLSYCKGAINSESFNKLCTGNCLVFAIYFINLVNNRASSPWQLHKLAKTRVLPRSTRETVKYRVLGAENIRVLLGLACRVDEIVLKSLRYHNFVPF